MLNIQNPFFSTVTITGKIPPSLKSRNRMNHNDPKRGPSGRATQERRASHTAHTRNKRFKLERKNGNLNILGFSNSERVDPGVPLKRPGKESRTQNGQQEKQHKRPGRQRTIPPGHFITKFLFSRKRLKDKPTDEIKLGAKMRSNTTKIFSPSRINTSQVPAK